VDTENIMQANSIVDLISSLAGMVGPVIGGILFSIVGLVPILYVSIGCFFVAAVMEIFIHIPFEKRQAEGNIIITGFNDLKESFGFMFKEQPILWKLSLIFASINLFLTFLGGVALQVLKGPMAIYIILLLGCSLMLVLSTLFQIQVMTYLQILTPKELTGKVISCVMCICMCTNPLGQFLYGIVFEKIGSSTYLPFYIAALIMLGISVFTRPMFYGMDQPGLNGHQSRG
jgi:MFS family permease